MWDSILSGMQGMGNSISNGMASFWDKANAPTDDVLAALADEEEFRFQNGITEATAEHTKAWNDVQNSNMGSKVANVMKAMGGMAGGSAGGGSAPQAPGRSGGFQVQTRDEYAEAMKALVDKYGQFMFNKQF